MLSPASFLNIIECCDNFKLADHRDELALFCLSGDAGALTQPIGLLWPVIVQALQDDNDTASKEERKPSWVFLNSGPNDCGRVTHVHFAAHLCTQAERSEALAAKSVRWRDAGLFAATIGGNQWRNELYPIYKDPFRDHVSSTSGFECTVERAAAALFGVVTFGVSMTIFQRSLPGGDGEMKMWIPTRAKTKQTWPGCLDNTIGGGIPAGMSVFESLVKESMEEASIQEDIIRSYARPAGAVSHFFSTQGKWLQPEVEYVYDLEIPSSATGLELEKFTPRPLDGEVESFEFLPLSEVISRMHKGLFKPNSALILVDFLIRHGYITPGSEPDYMEIITRMHGRFDYALWTC